MDNAQAASVILRTNVTAIYGGNYLAIPYIWGKIGHYSNILVRPKQEEKWVIFLKISLPMVLFEYSMSMMNNSASKKFPSSFELQAGENILYQTTGHPSWYTIAWKIFSGLITIAVLALISWFVLSGPVNSLLAKVIPSAASSVVAQILCLGLIPLIVIAWVAQDIASTIIGKFVLTDKRLWVRGSPYAWNITETQLDEIESLTYRRDAVFIRLKASKRILVHMLPDGKLLAKVYQDHFGKPR
jgi:hypothetical protein